MSTILQPLVDRLRAIPSARWEDVARAAGVAKTLPRKIATGDRSNPGVLTIQPLVEFFERVDRGEAKLPPGCEKELPFPDRRHGERRGASRVEG